MAVRRWWLMVGAMLLLVAGTGLGLLLRSGADPPASTASPVDVGFAQDMTVHHQQAVDMAATEITGGADPAVQNLAFDVLTGQQNQIGRMQGWLTAWGAPLLPTDGYMTWMSHDPHGGHAMDGGMGAVTSMPGMASSAELTALRRATPADRDVLFLQLMLRHHDGGTDMLVAGAEQAEVGYVRDLARQMLATQTAESELMTQMLRQRNASPLPLR